MTGGLCVNHYFCDMLGLEVELASSSVTTVPSARRAASRLSSLLDISSTIQRHISSASNSPNNALERLGRSERTKPARSPACIGWTYSSRKSPWTRRQTYDSTHPKARPRRPTAPPGRLLPGPKPHRSSVPRNPASMIVTIRPPRSTLPRSHPAAPLPHPLPPRAHYCSRPRSSPTGRPRAAALSPATTSCAQYPRVSEPRSRTENSDVGGCCYWRRRCCSCSASSHWQSDPSSEVCWWCCGVVERVGLCAGGISRSHCATTVVVVGDFWTKRWFCCGWCHRRGGN